MTKNSEYLRTDGVFGSRLVREAVPRRGRQEQGDLSQYSTLAITGS